MVRRRLLNAACCYGALVFALVFGLQRLTNSSPRPFPPSGLTGKQTHAGTVQFQIVATDSTEKERFSNEAITYLAYEQDAGGLTPQEAFQHVSTNEPSEIQGVDANVAVGRIKGELYLLDTFDVMSVTRKGSVAYVHVVYTREFSEDSLPVPAKAYFKVHVSGTLTEVKIVFDQRWEKFRPLDDVDEKLALRLGG